MLTGSPGQTAKLGRYLLKGGGTPNQKLMAATAALFAPAGEIHDAGALLADRMLAREEEEGPRPWEILCPDPHEGMYLFGHIGIIAAGIARPEHTELGARAAAIVSQELRLADLVASPDGDCRGLPGMRAPNAAGIGRRALTALRTVVRQRQGLEVVHRGPGGRPQPFKWKETSDRLIDGAAWWMKLLLDGPAGADLLRVLAPDAPLPKRLRLGLTVDRWDGGALAWLADPGREGRRQFVIHGSAAAKRERQGDGDEDPVDWIRVTWGSPGQHRVEAGSSWETPRPQAPAGARRTTIPGVVA